MRLLLAWLTHYGYAGLFSLLMLGIVGLPLPEETLLVFCGYLVYSGRLHFGLIYLAGLAGSICGISLSYYLGRSFGRKLLHGYGRYVRITPQRIHQVESLFNRIGAWVLSVGYFIPGVRHFTGMVAGMSELPYAKFAVFAYLGAAFWVGTFLTLGYAFGERWEHTSELAHRYILMGCAVGAGVGLVIWLVRRLRGK